MMLGVDLAIAIGILALAGVLWAAVVAAEEREIAVQRERLRKQEEAANTMRVHLERAHAERRRRKWSS